MFGQHADGQAVAAFFGATHPEPRQALGTGRPPKC